MPPFVFRDRGRPSAAAIWPLESGIADGGHLL
jgi:hypothetical protein